MGRVVKVTRRRLALSAVVATILIVGAIGGARWRHSRSYVGTTRAVVLRWNCANAIFYEDPSRTYDWWAAMLGQKRRPLSWWADGRPGSTGRIQTAEPKVAVTRQHGHTSLPRPLYEAVGRIRFNSIVDATFTSNAGGTMRLTREPAAVGHTDQCLSGNL